MHRREDGVSSFRKRPKNEGLEARLLHHTMHVCCHSYPLGLFQYRKTFPFHGQLPYFDPAFLPNCCCPPLHDRSSNGGCSHGNRHRGTCCLPNCSLPLHNRSSHGRRLHGKQQVQLGCLPAQLPPSPP